MQRTLLVILVAAFLAGCGAKAPETDLVIPINVRCSTCTDYIRCDDASGDPAVNDPAFSLYELQAKGPGYEITTIPEYFLQFVEPKTSYTRPLAVHMQMIGQSGQLDRHSSMEQTATIDIALHRVSLPDAWIDQKNGEWRGTDDSLKGICRMLGRQEGRQMADLFMEKAQ